MKRAKTAETVALDHRYMHMLVDRILTQSLNDNGYMYKAPFLYMISICAFASTKIKTKEARI